jgi:hypothetical protein
MLVKEGGLSSETHRVANQGRKIQRAGTEVLRPGEPILANVRAAAETSSLGLLGGAVVQAFLAGDERRRVEGLGFPAASNMILGVTDRRLLVFRAPFLFTRPRFRGEVPFEWLQGAFIERRGMSPRVRFVLSSGVEVTFTTYRRDHPDAFVRILNRAREARPMTTPPIAQPHSQPVVPPPPPL